MEKILLKPTEAAEALSLGRTRVYEMLATGELPSIRIGRSIRLPVAALQRWISERQSSLEAAHADDEVVGQ